MIDKFDSVNIKKSSTKWEKLFAAHRPGKGLVSRIYEELLKLNLKKEFLKKMNRIKKSSIGNMINNL